MKPKSILVASFLTLLFWSLAIKFSNIEANAPTSFPVHNLNTGLNYTSIQAAINANETLLGHTILVDAGTYYEHVVINKTLSLVGENSSTTIIDGNWTGVVINVARNDVIISGLTAQRSGSIYWENAGILLDNVENCSISGNILTENSFAGLELNNSRRCSISGNSIIRNGGVGITLVTGSFNHLYGNSLVENGWSALTLNDEANNNTVSGNSMTSNNLAVTGHCINLYRSSNNTIQKNNITGDDNGIRLEYWSNYNTISRNRIANNTQAGFSVEKYSNYNTILLNSISKNGIGFYLEYSTQNTIVGNSILENDQQVYTGAYSVSAWNAGYPSGGNYWSDYNGTDRSSGPAQDQIGSDGIGDTIYAIGMNNSDRYPLMGNLHSYNISWIDSGHIVELISNSTISAFDAGFWIEHPENRMIRFNVTGESATAGFCRICIPHALMNGTYQITVGGAEPYYTNHTLYDNGTHRWIYFSYSHSTLEVVIVPELPSFLILPLLMIAALLAVIIYRKNIDNRESSTMRTL